MEKKYTREPYQSLIVKEKERLASSTSSENDYARGDRVWWSAASKVRPTLLNLDSHASKLSRPKLDRVKVQLVYLRVLAAGSHIYNSWVFASRWTSLRSRLGT